MDKPYCAKFNYYGIGGGRFLLASYMIQNSWFMPNNSRISAQRESLVVAVTFVLITWSLIGNTWWLVLPYSGLSILLVYICFSVENKRTLCETTTNQTKDNTKNTWTKIRDSNRSSQSYGLWCTYLLPIATVAMTCDFNKADSPMTLACEMIFQFPILLYTFKNVIPDNIPFPRFLEPLCCISGNLILLKYALNLDWFLSAFLSLLVFLVNLPSMIYIFCRIQKSFTLGEFTIIWHGMLLALIKSLTELISKGSHLDAYQCIIYLGYLACFSLVWSCYVSRTFWPNLICIGFISLIVSYVILEQDIIMFIVKFLTKDRIRICVINFWLLCVFCTLYFVSHAWQRSKLTTMHRKFFHLTASLVLLSGLFYDPELLLLASVLIFYIFVVIEVIRLLNVPPLGDGINQAFSRFLDDQDQGPLILTPIYLLVGTFLPLWLKPCTRVFDVRFNHFAGFIAVGVGDAAASIGGSMIGRVKWLDSKKTIEGTTASVAGQMLAIAFVLCFVRSFYLFDISSNLYLFVCCVVLSLLETFTNQVDNLILPLVAFVLFYKI